MFIIYWQRHPPQLAHISQSTRHTQTHILGEETHALIFSLVSSNQKQR